MIFLLTFFLSTKAHKNQQFRLKDVFFENFCFWHCVVFQVLFKWYFIWNQLEWFFWETNLEHQQIWFGNWECEPFFEEITLPTKQFLVKCDIYSNQKKKARTTLTPFLQRNYFRNGDKLTQKKDAGPKCVYPEILD